MKYRLRSKQTEQYIVEKDYCVLTVCEKENATEWNAEDADKAIEFDNDLYKEEILEDFEIITNNGYVKVKGFELLEFERKFGIEVFYYISDKDTYVITERSSGTRIQEEKSLLVAKQAIHNRFKNEETLSKYKLAIKAHFKLKYSFGIKVRMLNNTAGGMFKESKV